MSNTEFLTSSFNIENFVFDIKNRPAKKLTKLFIIK